MFSGNIKLNLIDTSYIWSLSSNFSRTNTREQEQFPFFFKQVPHFNVFKVNNLLNVCRWIYSNHEFEEYQKLFRKRNVFFYDLSPAFSMKASISNAFLRLSKLLSSLRLRYIQILVQVFVFFLFKFITLFQHNSENFMGYW